jgi:uncharacterized membrane protein
MRFLLVAMVIAVATFGSWLSIKIKSGSNPLLYIIPGIIGGLTWGMVVKYSGLSIIVASISFDVLYAVTFYIFLTILSGTSLTIIQGLGILLSIAGTILVSFGAP